MQNYELLYRKKRGIFYYFKIIYSKKINPFLFLLFTLGNILLFIFIYRWRSSINLTDIKKIIIIFLFKDYDKYLSNENLNYSTDISTLKANRIFAELYQVKKKENKNIDEIINQISF
jgi:hypothetical protein